MNKMIKDASNRDYPLHTAARYGFTLRARSQEATVEQLDSVNDLGETAMHIAALNNKIEFVKILLSRGANPLLRDLHQRLPIHLACAGNHLSLLNAFLADKVGRTGLEARDKKGNFCIHLAAAIEGSTQMLKKLARVANIDAANLEGETCLIVAARLGNLRNVRTIVNCGANVRLTDSAGRTFLHAAAANGHDRVVEYIMNEKRIDVVDHVTTLGETALVLALKKRHEEAASALIVHGADCFLEDGWGRTAKDYALLSSLQVASKLLQGVQDGDVWNDRRLIRYRLSPERAQRARTPPASVSDEEEEMDTSEDGAPNPLRGLIEAAVNHALGISSEHGSKIPLQYSPSSPVQEEPMELTAGTPASNDASDEPPAKKARWGDGVRLTEENRAQCLEGDCSMLRVSSPQFSPPMMPVHIGDEIRYVDSVAEYLDAPLVIDISSDDNEVTEMESSLNTPQPAPATATIKTERDGTPAPWFNQVMDIVNWLELDFQPPSSGHSSKKI